MNCDCIDKADRALAEFDTEVEITFVGLEMAANLQVPTRWLDGVKPKRGKKPKAVIAAFCPFCGVRAQPSEKVGQ